jgi:hypothetical protein
MKESNVMSYFVSNSADALVEAVSGDIAFIYFDKASSQAATRECAATAYTTT